MRVKDTALRAIGDVCGVMCFVADIAAIAGSIKVSWKVGLVNAVLACGMALLAIESFTRLSRSYREELEELEEADQ